MALSCSQNTLSYHQARVLTCNRDMSQVPLVNTTKRMVQYCDSPKKTMAVPEKEALKFYGLNHGMSIIRSKYDVNEILPPDVHTFVETYYSAVSESAMRVFYYLLIICTREARHNKSMTTDYKNIVSKFGVATTDFHKNGGGEETIHAKLKNNPPDTTIGNYVSSLAWVFYNCSWHGGYGGKAWGQVTDCLVNFVYGKISAEMMLDTVWTLAHNNGPIFNKQHLYTGYSPTLYRLLDVQRSGQIPEFILHDSSAFVYADDELRGRMLQVRAWSGGQVGDFVDWFKVAALGALRNYSGDQIKQKKAGQMTEWADADSKKQIEMKLLQEQLAAEKIEKLALEKAKKMETQYLVGEGTVLTKIKMERLTA